MSRCCADALSMSTGVSSSAVQSTLRLAIVNRDTFSFFLFKNYLYYSINLLLYPFL